MKTSIKTMLCVSAIAAPWSVVTAASAQEQGGESGEIVVTAQRREQAIQDVAAPITAVSGETLQALGIEEPTDLQQIVPSMVAGVDHRGEAAIAIRGVGYNQVGAPGIAVHVDGVYQPRPAMGDIAQMDIARVEVLRGPQGTLYGRNANGGVVNFITESPSPEFEGSLRASYQSYDESRVQGVLNVPLGENWGLRANISRWERGEGFVENVVPGNPDLDRGESLAGRVHLAGELSPNLSLDLIGTASDRSGPFVYYTNINVPTQPVLVGAIVPLEPRRTSANGPSDTERQYRALTGVLTLDVGDWTLKSITGLQQFDDDWEADFDGTNVNATRLSAQQSTETLSQEFNASGSFGSVDAVAGVFFMNDELATNFVFNFPLGAAPAFGPGGGIFIGAPSYETEVHAVFADLTFNITDRLRLMAGLRYSEETQNITQDSHNTNFFGNPVVPVCDASFEISFSSTTPRVGVQYDLSDNSNVYATYSEGQKAGGFNYRGLCGDTFEPEEVTAYELGWKNTLLDGAMTLNFSVFQYDYTELQVEQILGPSAFVNNAGGAEVTGFEVETAWRPDDHWTINGTIALIDATFNQSAVLVDGAPPPTARDINGLRLPNTPETSITLGLAYETGPVIAGGPLTFRVDTNYRSDYYLRPFNQPADQQDAYTLVNGSVSWDSQNDAFTVRLFGSNLTDEDYYASMGAASQQGSRLVTWGAPQQVGIELQARF
jgi:iron complex outermembrane recepter protein